MDIYVIGKNGERLMPTSRRGKVRHLLEDGKAKIVNHKPFTIQLLYDSTTYTQPVEVCVDAGYEHIGVSVKSDSKEFAAVQYDLLPDEKLRHDDQRRYRRTRRNRLRYRRCKFLRKEGVDGWFAPSIQHKADAHVDIVSRICSVCPVTSITVEVGQFDPKELEAIAKGLPLPQGKEYQEPKIHADAVLRLAVFQRDNYQCAVCGKSGITDGVKLHLHHGLFWKGIHGSSPDEMLTVCDRCHTSANHKPGGKLHGLVPKKIDLRGAAFMNAVRYHIVSILRSEYGADMVHITFGADTKEARKALGLEKSHTADAYCMGVFHPLLRAAEEHFKKQRRNNRILEKFYDAKYVDIRDGSVKTGSQLGCNRTNRRIPRNNPQNLRMYHGKKVSKGRRSIRTERYSIHSGDIVVYIGATKYDKATGVMLLKQNTRYTCHGTNHNGEGVCLLSKKESPTKKQIFCKASEVTVGHYNDGWRKISKTIL